MLDVLRTRSTGGRPLHLRETLHGAAGAALGIALCGVLARSLIDGRISFDPLLATPIGASAVLVFAVPASPLAQPRAVIGGNVLAALAGVACGSAFSEPLLAASAAVGLAIALMAVCGCLHPPGGAMALGAAIAASSPNPPGYDYALIPVGLCSLLLVLAGVLYGRVSGHAYPHRVVGAASPHGTRDRPPAERFGYTPADLDGALARYGELLDVGRDDLDALFREVELQAHRRLHAVIACGQIMSGDVIALRIDEGADIALARLQRHDLRTAPVIDASGRVRGMARRAELLAGAHGPVGEVVDPVAHTVHPDDPVETLLPLLSSGAAHEVLVVDQDDRLVGVITQTDLLSMLYRAHVVEAVVSARAA
jgi:CBS domain-containing membrane protein